VKKLLALPLIASLSLPLIHALKLERIQHRCDSTRSRAADTFRPQEDDINDAIGKVNSLQYKSITDRGGLKFITGDFDEDDGRVRCGGVARIVSESLAEKGFDTRIYLEGYPDGTMHYYAIVRKSGRSWRINGSPPNVFASEISPRVDMDGSISSWLASSATGRGQ
jgi:hypothetical protein